MAGNGELLERYFLHVRTIGERKHATCKSTDTASQRIASSATRTRIPATYIARGKLHEERKKLTLAGRRASMADQLRVSCAPIRFILCAPCRRRRHHRARCNTRFLRPTTTAMRAARRRDAFQATSLLCCRYIRASRARRRGERRAAAPLREAPAESINKTIGYIHMFFKSTNAIIYFVLSTRGETSADGRTYVQAADARGCPHRAIPTAARLFL